MKSDERRKYESGEKEKNDEPFENFIRPKDPLLKLSQ